jgi:hypothetical protein
MPKILHGSILAIVAGLLFSGCSQFDKPEVTAGRWIRFDAATQHYSVAAQQVPRGALLDELKSVAGADVRPQPEREAPVTAQAKNLDLDTLIALLLPPGTRPTVRLGAREVVAALPESAKPKQGAPPRPAAGAVAKPDAALEVALELKHTGTLKAAAETPYTPHEVSGSNTKPQVATLLPPEETLEPKKPLAMRAPRATVRLQLLFEDGAPPRLIDARAIEGRALAQRFVTGTYLFVVTAVDGRALEAGTFQDPLLQHSYLPEGQHSVGRARSGIAGISIARENLSGAVLHIVDLTGMPMPRELNEHVVRTALERGKSALQLETSSILRRLDQEDK